MIGKGRAGDAGSDPTAIHSIDSGTDQRIETIQVVENGHIKIVY